MRIIAGTLGGRRLTAVGAGDPGAQLRPTTDRVREALFSTLTGGRFGDPLHGAVVLDLFAGTGALGLEALSRGAAQVTFVENGRKALSLLASNIAVLQVTDRCRVLRGDATRLPRTDGPAATLVLLDPPYGRGLGDRALRSALQGGWIAPGALVVWEESTPMAAPEGFTLTEHRRYGDTHVTFLDGLA